MLGSLDVKYKEAVIIGAGFAGLLAAYRLLARGYQIKLYESAERAGGLINTIQTEYGLAEAAAHSIRSSPEMDALFSELNVEAVIAHTSKKYILRDGKFQTFPLNIFETGEMVARATSATAKADGDNLGDWALRHLGRGTLENLIYPMMQGIYAAQPDELSSRLVFPKFMPNPGQSLLRHALSLPQRRYKPRIMAPRAGMAALTEALFHAIGRSPKAKVFMNEKIAVLPDAASVTVTVPARAAAQILEDGFPESAAALADLRYAPLISATVFLDKSSHRAPDGIGVLCAAHEPRRALGVLFNSASFENRVRDEDRVACYTVMLGGTRDAAVLNLTDIELQRVIEQELAALLNLSAPPLQTIIHRWPDAIPLYSPGLARAHEKIRQDFCAQPGRILFGNYTGQISLRGMAGSF